MRDRAATRALVLGLLALPFGVFAPFAIWSGARSLRRIRRLRRRAARRGQRRRGVDRGTDWARDVSNRDGLLAHRFVIARILIWLLIVAVAAFTYPGVLVVSLPTRVAPPPTASRGPAGPPSV